MLRTELHRLLSEMPMMDILNRSVCFKDGVLGNFMVSLLQKHNHCENSVNEMNSWADVVFAYMVLMHHCIIAKVRWSNNVTELAVTFFSFFFLLVLIYA
ncbi:hypothetical protein SRHO_G00145840 [Serrasalmus rhombeus]